MVNRVILIILFAALIALGATLYSNGYSNGKQFATKKLTEYEFQIRDYNEKLLKANAELNEKVSIRYVERIRIIREKSNEISEAANNIVPSRCDVATGWVRLHDAAATNSNIDTASIADGTSSGIKDNQALSTVVQNYSICHQNAERLRELQSWITATRELGNKDGR